MRFALGVEDDPGLVVDQIVRIVGKEWVDAPPGNPCRLGIGQRDFLGRLASTAAAARSADISTAILLITIGGIESRQVLANRSRCLLRLRPANRLLTRNPLLLVHIRLDQARINGECFTPDQSGSDAHRHYPLKHSA
jgi:hypothetical protein